MIQPSKRAILDAGCRPYFDIFIARAFQTVSAGDRYSHNWHIDVVADALNNCIRGDTKRLIITMPPRNLKSICASVAFPAYALGINPSCSIIAASYSSDLTTKMARDCRSVMMSDWYRRVFPGTQIKRATDDRLETTAGGFRYATSVGGTLTGLGADILIIDDPVKPLEAMSASQRAAAKQWYDGTLYSRLNSKRDGVIILIMQRLHMDDLVAHVLEKEHWTHIDLPAIAERDEVFLLSDGRRIERKMGAALDEQREPLPVLEQIKSTIGSFNFSAQYQQRPVPETGNMIKWDWFQPYDTLPAGTHGGKIVQSWDTASKATELADYSVCTTWFVAGKNYYLLDVFRKRLEFPALKKAVIDLAQQRKVKTLLIEDAASGTGLIQQLNELSDYGVPNPIAYRPHGDKVMRMAAQSAVIEAGQVHLPRAAPWLDDFKVEILAFPHGRHDDQVDSLSQLLDWSQNRPQHKYFIGDI